MTEVVFVCSPLTVATANGSGNPVPAGQLNWPSSLLPEVLTEYIAFVKPVRSNDYVLVRI